MKEAIALTHNVKAQELEGRVNEEIMHRKKVEIAAAELFKRYEDARRQLEDLAQKYAQQMERASNQQAAQMTETIVPPAEPAPQQREIQPAAPARQHAQYKLYTVQSGDSLSIIAKRFSGDWHNYTQIAQDNEIKDATKIYPGNVLKIRPELCMHNTAMLRAM